mmetsp:Transcript_33228/g.60065  ORF Transcript_33228/g.60065 Transcript_33228/m.60065 type:complete len:294 (-) Transcript_33228:645-1526(-)
MVRRPRIPSKADSNASRTRVLSPPPRARRARPSREIATESQILAAISSATFRSISFRFISARAGTRSAAVSAVLPITFMDKLVIKDESRPAFFFLLLLLFWGTSEAALFDQNPDLDLSPSAPFPPLLLVLLLPPFGCVSLPSSSSPPSLSSSSSSSSSSSYTSSSSIRLSPKDVVLGIWPSPPLWEDEPPPVATTPAPDLTTASLPSGPSSVKSNRSSRSTPRLFPPPLLSQTRGAFLGLVSFEVSLLSPLLSAAEDEASGRWRLPAPLPRIPRGRRDTSKALEGRSLSSAVV